MSRYEDDRTYYSRERGPRGSEREQYYEDDRAWMSGGRGGGRGPSPDRSNYDRGYDRRPPPRGYDDDIIRDRRYYEDDRYERRTDRSGSAEYDRRVIFDRERDREYQREPSPRRPPVLVRRQSSLDTYDRRPLRGFEPREEYPVPVRREDVRREDFRAPAYTPIPLPRTEDMPPPRRGEHDREYYDDERIIDREYYANDGRPFPDVIREREVIHTHDERDRSRESRGARTHKSSKHSPPSSRSSSSSRTRSHAGTSVRSEYPKRGKTKIPMHLVSTRAIMDLGYTFIIEGNSIIIGKALAQEHIDEVLRLSDEYKKTEVHITDGKGGEIVEEKIEHKEEVVVAPVQVPVEVPVPVVVPAPPPPPPVVIAPPPVAEGPIIIDARPSDDLEIVEETVIRTSSPHRRHHHHHDELIIDRRRSRSRSRSGREIRAEIKALERELAHRPRVIEDYDIVRSERMEDGQLVVYEERIERAHTHKPARIEKDKKGPPPGLLKAMLTTLT